ncbi:MAG: PKD domain-containing protein [Bacteroidetes bacterium]|nr:PKD domain-containing protein [Bacteroidota bacterium]MDA0943342.1 PKD domain-containing protein [Bacteroidota bacterium]MDA1111044.1 PKD domain-containing protein [Bacteroidota bacterium]
MKKGYSLMLTIAVLGALKAQTVTTYVGIQYQGSGEYNATANNNLDAEYFSMPQSVAFDTNNRIWVTDQHNLHILDGSISRNRGGYLGDPNEPGGIGYDNGTGSVARFATPAGIAVHPSTNDIYICDRDNGLIRKGNKYVNSAQGTIWSTFAGKYTFLGDHADGFLADAYFSSPEDMVIMDNGDMYIVDFGNDCIRKISGGSVYTVAGKPMTSGDVDGTGSSARFYAPMGICIESNNTLLIADRNNKKIKRYTISTGKVETVISSGLDEPTDVVYAEGSIYIIDRFCIKIWNGTSLSVFAGSSSVSGYTNGNLTDARFRSLSHADYRPSDKSIYVSDLGNNVIRRVPLVLSPVINFSANATAVSTNQTVILTANCYNTNNYQWTISPSTYTLQAGSKLTDSIVYVSFNNTGSYTVDLKGSNPSFSSNLTKNSYINVSTIAGSKPGADFAADQTKPAPLQIVQLIDLSSNSPTSYSWTIAPNTFNYQGGTTASSRNPQVSFSAAGTYTVSLTVSNANGSNQKTKDAYISVQVNGVEAPSIALVLFPNPSSGEFAIRGLEQSQIASISSINALGQTFAIQELSDKSYRLQGPAGWYSIQVITHSGQRITVPLIVTE